VRIYAMTATFGKLSAQTLTLEPGMNIIHAPNEWGKSTWCAFLMAMLYGIDTGSRSKAGFLADKEHYAPWSGEPMSGSMDISWQGRDITIQRRQKGRVPMADVKAFETHTGVAVPELSVNNCGEVLLGVERSVFARAGFLKLSEMPVTEDDKLRRRLNALVTTADESGASDDLAQKLRELKNRCRFNRKGLLPELESRQAAVEENLQHIQALKHQMESIGQRQQALSEQAKLLENHRQALMYAQQQAYTQKLTAAQTERDRAALVLTQAEAACKDFPAPEKVRADMAAAQQLRDVRDALHMQAQMMPPLPQNPEDPAPFRGMTEQQAVDMAQEDSEMLQKLTVEAARPTCWIAGGVLLLLAVAVAVLAQMWAGWICAGALMLAGICVMALGGRKKQAIRSQIRQLHEKYRPLPPAQWCREAQAYATVRRQYNRQLQQQQAELADIQRGLAENRSAIEALTGGTALAQFEQACKQMQEQQRALEDAQRQYRQAEDFLQALAATNRQVAPPQMPDTLTESAQETAKKLTDIQLEQRMLHQKLGQCQGQIDALGQEDALEGEKQALKERITGLEQHYRALTIAQQTLQQATQELQKRFAPRISQRAQALFAQLTGQRYQRLSLGQDLSLTAGAQGENTLRESLWRSDGTVDQLYLALRLAVAEELTPQAPLVLDDALVRFDETRLAAAMEILKEEALSRQVILFTCQGREGNV